jgi:hypothetical protein
MMVSGMATLTAGLNPGSPEWNTVLGCGGPKLRILGPGREDGNGQVVFHEPAAGAAPGTATVSSFSANRVAIDAEAPAADRWLVYADGYHPGWRATVNGAPVPVRAAFAGLKAVKLASGRNLVVLEFRRPMLDAIARGLATYGVLFSLAVLFVLARTMAREAAGGSGC